MPGSWASRTIYCYIKEGNQRPALAQGKNHSKEEINLLLNKRKDCSSPLELCLNGHTTIVLKHPSSWSIPKHFQHCVDRRIYLACNWCFVISFNSTLIQRMQLRTGVKKNFPSDWNFKANNYWCWKASRLSELTFLLMRSLKIFWEKPSLFVYSRGVLSSNTAASSNCNHYSLQLENWLVPCYPVCLLQQGISLQSYCLTTDSEENPSASFQLFLQKPEGLEVTHPRTMLITVASISSTVSKEIELSEEFSYSVLDVILCFP